MANSVAAGYSTASAFAHWCRTRGTSTSAHHVDQAKWRLGIAAYWFETFDMAPESNDHSPPMACSVSTKWYDGGNRRGGSSGKNENPMSASAVVHASVVRHFTYVSGKRMNSQMMQPAVTAKWNVP